MGNTKCVLMALGQNESVLLRSLISSFLILLTLCMLVHESSPCNHKLVKSHSYSPILCHFMNSMWFSHSRKAGLQDWLSTNTPDIVIFKEAVSNV